MTSFAFSLLLTAIFLTASCSKEGPAGPQGAEGPQGPAGPSGPAGNTGATGTANVIYSGWLSFQQTQRDTVIDGTKVKVNHLTAPQLTQTMIGNGMVLAYMRFSTTVLQLPYTSHAGGKPNTVGFVPQVSKLLITRFTHDNSGSIGFGAVQFRYILIPGGVPASGRSANMEKVAEINNQLYTASELKAMSYEQVCALLGIQG